MLAHNDCGATLTNLALAFAPNPGNWARPWKLWSRDEAQQELKVGHRDCDGQEQAIGGARVAWRTPVPFKGWCTQILVYTKHATIMNGAGRQ